jgi:hypothetical protein
MTYSAALLGAATIAAEMNSRTLVRGRSLERLSRRHATKF